MLRLKLISIFMCMLMSMQMLPISQIGKMLSNNQWTEELPHSSSSETGKTDNSSNVSPFLPANNNPYHSIMEENLAMRYILISASVPSNHSTDVVSPPPDVALS